MKKKIGTWPRKENIKQCLPQIVTIKIRITSNIYQVLNVVKLYNAPASENRVTQFLFFELCQQQGHNTQNHITLRNLAA